MSSSSSSSGSVTSIRYCGLVQYVSAGNKRKLSYGNLLLPNKTSILETIECIKLN